MASIWVFLMVWGVWLITPVLIDGVDAVARLFVVWRHGRGRRRQRVVEDSELPTVSVIVPAHNEAAVIDRCLNSLKAQQYPHHLLEIIVVDDGSTDATADRVEGHVSAVGRLGEEAHGAFRYRGESIAVGPFHGTLALVKNGHQGKAHALNAGIRVSSGEIVINVDCDTTLAPDAVREIAAAFVRQHDLGAATGDVEIDWDIIEKRDESGRLVLDAGGDIVPRRLTAIERFLATSQFLEYLSSFSLGRRAQAYTSTMYTLAGACSAFRRSILEECGYRNVSVSEDTCLTFDLHRTGVSIGFVAAAKAYLEPVVDWDGLYAQRVRWARGQIEVCGLNRDVVGSRGAGRLGRRALPKMLLLDHTMAFPRLVWAPLLLFFPALGYSWKTLAVTLVALYAFYLTVEIVNTLAVFAAADEHTRGRIEQSAWALVGLPLYRFVVFYFRFSGFLVTLTEKQQWTMRGPVRTGRSDILWLKLKSMELAKGVTAGIVVSFLTFVWACRALPGEAARSARSVGSLGTGGLLVLLFVLGTGFLLGCA